MSQSHQMREVLNKLKENDYAADAWSKLEKNQSAIIQGAQEIMHLVGNLDEQDSVEVIQSTIDLLEDMKQELIRFSTPR